MKCKVCGGNLTLQKDFYRCENCGAKVSVASFYENVEVFLLCQEQDEQGRRTESSLRVEELASKLEGAKLKVFSPFRDTGDLYGDDATLVSNAALKSAKSVLMLGNSSDVFSSLLNENKVFLEGKKTIPLFFGMEANQIPKELSAIQGIDVGKIGFEKDLIAGLYNLLGKKEELVFKEKKNRLPLYLSIGVVALFILLAGVFVFLYMKTDLFVSDEPVVDEPVVIIEESIEQTTETEEKEPELTPAEKYQKAVSLSEEGKLADAITLFLELGEYEDSTNRLHLLYASYEGYYENEDNTVRIHFTREGEGVASTELIFVNENGNQIKILEVSNLSDLGTSFEFTDSEGNAGTITIVFRNDGLEVEAKTTTKNSEVFAKDQTILLPLTARSDKSPMERITAETILGWLRQGVTYQDIIRQGVELVFVDGITDGGAPMHQATIYKIKDTEIQLCFPRYDTMNCTADMIEAGGYFGVDGRNQELPIEQCKLYSVAAPASVLVPNKVGSQFGFAQFWEEGETVFVPGLKVSEYEKTPFNPPYWNGTSLDVWGGEKENYTLAEESLVGVFAKAVMHPSVYELAKQSFSLMK